MLEETSKFISNYLEKKVHIDKVISGKKSESTNSFYYIFKLNNGKVIGFSISDHIADNHTIGIDDNLEDADINDILYELDDVTDNVISDYPSGTLDEDGYYNINLAKNYDVEESGLIGKSSVDRALAGQNYEITASELLYDNQVLKVTYNNDDVEYYINYLPVGEIEDNSDTATAVSIYNHFENPRKVYHSNQLTGYSEDEVNDDEDVNENIFDENGDIYDDDVDVVKIFGKNYYVSGYDAPDLEGELK